jgi:hypothetical protein
VLRAQTLSLRRRDYVEAARATGERTWRIIGFEILPNLTAIIASGFVGTVIFAVMSEITSGQTVRMRVGFTPVLRSTPRPPAPDSAGADVAGVPVPARPKEATR